MQNKVVFILSETRNREKSLISREGKRDKVSLQHV